MAYEQSSLRRLLQYDAEIKSKMSAEKQMMSDFVMHSYKKINTAGSSEFEKAKDLCANWIAKHYRPIQIVEDKGFIELVKFFQMNQILLMKIQPLSLMYAFL